MTTPMDFQALCAIQNKHKEKFFICVTAMGCLNRLFKGFFADLLTAMTLHFYCFYIYSLRLYQLWTYGLKELWNLFRGLKYNQLKVNYNLW